MEPYIIAGPNGVGKTRFARKFLPKYAHCKTFSVPIWLPRESLPFLPKLRLCALAGQCSAK